MIRFFQVLIGFLGQAILSVAFDTMIDFLWYIDPSKPRLRKRLEDLYLWIITTWVSVGFAMAISAFTQWRTITIFHLTVCTLLANAIPTVRPTWISPKNSRRMRLKIIYCMSYSILRIAASSYLIYRLVRRWRNSPGPCLLVSSGTVGTIQGSNERHTFAVMRMTPVVLLDTCYIIAALVKIGRLAFCESREEAANQNTRDRAKGKKHTLIFFTRLVIRGSVFTLTTHAAIAVILANRAYILGNVNVLSFGQVIPLAALAASFYRIWDSYVGRPFLPPTIESFNQLTNAWQNLKSNRMDTSSRDGKN